MQFRMTDFSSLFRFSLEIKKSLFEHKSVNQKRQKHGLQCLNRFFCFSFSFLATTAEDHRLDETAEVEFH